jgi:galactoside O-acetyltransferase
MEINMNTFYSTEELKQLGIRQFGNNVLISRNAILYHPDQLTIGHDVRIDDFCILSGSITLESNIHIAQFCGLYGGDSGIWMQDYSSLSSKCSVYATSDDYSGDSMTNPMIPMKYKPGSIDEKVVIEKYVAIGASSVVLPGITLAEGSSFTAMSLCIRNSETWTINAGIPARRVKDRSKKLLELEKEFKSSKDKTDSTTD